MVSSNGDKSKAGVYTLQSLQNVLSRMKRNFPTQIEYEMKDHYGYENINTKQFTVNARINFYNNKQQITRIWLVMISSSYRSDRIAGTEFNIEHIIKLIGEKTNNTPIETFFLIPNSTNSSVRADFEKFSSKVKNGKVFTYFQNVLTLSMFRELLLRVLTDEFDQGERSNVLGEIGETAVANAFSNPMNVEIWNSAEKDQVLKSEDYELFKTILQKFDVHGEKLSILTVQAQGVQDDSNSLYNIDLNRVIDPETNTFAGMPKTDVYIKVRFENNNKVHEKELKLSIKKPDSGKSKRISVHQGNVENLLKDLKSSIPQTNFFASPKEFEKLTLALENFQKFGAPTKMDSIQRQYLDDNLYKINNWLTAFFLFGENNHRFNNIQVSNGLVVFNPNDTTVSAFTKEEVEIQMSSKKPTGFGTPFSWTYASGTRGKGFQIKASINFNK